MKITFTRVCAFAVFLVVLSLLASGQITAAVAGKGKWNDLPVTLLFNALTGIVVAFIFYFVFELVRKLFQKIGGLIKTTSDEVAEYKVSSLAVGVILTLTALSALVGVSTERSMIAYDIKSAEAEKPKLAEAAAAEKERLAKQEEARQRVAKRKEAEQQRVAALSPAQRAAEEKAAQAKAAAAEKAAAKAAAEHARRKSEDFGDPPVSNSRYRNSYAIVELYLERSMGDPQSLKMGDCTEVRRETAGWVVGCSYRGKNAFGGMVQEFSWFIIRNNRVILTADVSAYRR